VKVSRKEMNSPKTELKTISPLVRDVIDLLESNDYDCSSPGRLLGVSGTDHEFDVVAHRGLKTIVISSLCETSQDMLEMKLMSLRAMVWDCSPDFAVVILPQGANLEEAKRFASVYNLTFVERIDPAYVYQEIQRLL
jgi:hypothetical protein